MSESDEGLRIARARIAREARERTGELDLRGLRLAHLPEALFDLEHLRKLQLGRARRAGAQGASKTFSGGLAGLERLRNLVELDCALTQVADLSPLAGLAKLQRLSCWNTKVADLSPLAGLANLVELDCSFTQVADLSPLAGLASLRSFDCGRTQVTDLSPLAGLTNLQSLTCGRTEVADLSPLAGLASLQSLTCARTKITDLSPLASLTNLTLLDCADTEVTDLSPLAGLSSLESLNCGRTKVTDLSPLAGLAKLTSFDCTNTEVTDLSPLAGLATLQSLNCGRTQVTDLSPLAGLASLLSLNCWGTRVADLSPLGGLASLHFLDCSQTQVADLSPLASLVSLRSLTCWITKVADLSPIAGLASLGSLSCMGTLVADLSPLAGLASLELLNCSRTPVADLSPLAGLASLQLLDCSGTKVADLSPLAGLASLQSLDCSDTQVADLGPLLALPGLTSIVAAGCRIAALPQVPAGPAGLWRLDLRKNRIRTLPPSLGMLRSLEAGAERSSPNNPWGLALDDNPLEGPLPDLIAPGQPEATINVLRWLRGQLDAETLPGSAGSEPHEDVLADVPDIPAQSPGIHVAAYDDGTLGFAPPADLDRDGNNIRRMRGLHPELRLAAADALAALRPDADAHAGLFQTLDRFSAMVDRPLEQVDVFALYSAGVRLENAVRAAREATSRPGANLPALSLAADEALGSLLQLHFPFLLATRDGLEMLDAEERRILTPDDLARLRDAAVAVAKKLRERPDLIRPELAAAVSDAAEDIGRGFNAARGTVVGLGATGNIVSALLQVGALGTGVMAATVVAGTAGTTVVSAFLAMVAERSPTLRGYAQVFAAKLDELPAASWQRVKRMMTETRDFARKIEPELRRLADSDTSLAWLRRVLDWLKRD